MPAISKIRFTNVVYEGGEKRYNDDLFRFEGYNGAIVLENGGGKTVFIQTLLQAVIPHTDLGVRKIRDTLKLEGPAHIAIEWVISEKPRRYVVTAVSLFLSDNKIDSLRYVYEYSANDMDGIEGLPFVRDDGKRPAERFEMQEYYAKKIQQSPLAKTFSGIKSYRHFLEDQYHIIENEWDSILKINKDEGGIEAFFDNCKIEKHLYDRLLIPTVEKSISGYDEKQFANIFEEQQKSFKLYKELRAQIAEYEAIEEELTAFVRANEVLYSKEQVYDQRKVFVKGVYSLTNQQRETAEREVDLLERAMQKLEVDCAVLSARLDSYTIRLKEQELHAEMDTCRELAMERDRIRGNIFTIQKSYYSLQMAKQQSIAKKQLELTVHYIERIGQLDREADADELADGLTTVQREIKGYFMEQEEKYAKEKSLLEFELRPIKEELLACVKEEEMLRKEHIRVEKEKTGKETRIESLEQSMQRIRHAILSNVEQETIASRLPKWIEDQTRIDETIVSVRNGTKKSLELLLGMKVKKDEMQETIKKESIEKAHFEAEVRRMEQAHTAQKEQLANLSFSLSRIDSLYWKQTWTEQTMVLKIDRMKNDKEEKLTLERLAYRFIDDYAEQDVFFADPFMEKQLQNWSNSIGLLETGVRYLNGLGLPIDEQLARYPYWPVTLITTEDKKATLVERINSIGKNLLHPIHVIDLQQAKAILESETEVRTETIIPLHWQENIDTHSFTDWKEALSTEAEKAKANRREVEDQLQLWESALRSLRVFFETFPYDIVKETEAGEIAMKDQLRQSERLAARLKKELEELEEKIAADERYISDLKDELGGLEQKVTEGRRHETEAKEVARLKEESESIRLQLEALDVSVRKLRRRTAANKDEESAIQDKMNAINMNVELLLHDSHYRLVLDRTPLFTDKTLALLKVRAESINDELKKISSSRREIETERKIAQDRHAEAKQALKLLRDDWTDFEEGIDFPENGDLQIEHYRNRQRIEDVQLKQADIAYNNQDKIVSLVSAKLDELKKSFSVNHPNLVVFTFPEQMHVVKNNLSEDETKLNVQREQYIIGLDRLGKERVDIQNALIKLDAFAESDHFNSMSIVEKQLTEEEVNEFTYGRSSFVQQVTSDMKKGRVAVDAERGHVADKRHAFNDYVRRNMTDAKMRDNLFQGLEHKRNFTELVAFHQNIRSKMNSIIRFNEESIREHDERLEQFVRHMHEHTRMVVRELEIIPTKTRVKFGTETKQMYNFGIPAWEEKDGVSRLRAYIDEILGWIEHSRYADPDGKTNKGKIRSDVEKWFATPQLLRIILQNSDMKVSCRKVTNDNEVTSKSFSWRESNEWSGGEKWSKNMTLFLGLLNYVAEKKKLLDTSMKRNRAVILDNPFGKASSEHVLSPVFFIAEKLGFQIIALTAHAEGKFLRDYFPVIYSCRLRNTKDTSKMIMTKEKTVNRAYFQDHEPVALERLGDSEQLSLLD